MLWWYADVFWKSDGSERLKLKEYMLGMVSIFERHECFPNLRVTCSTGIFTELGK